jgi:hypothetical protein
MAFGVNGRLGKETQEAQAVIDGDDNYSPSHKFYRVVWGAAPVDESTTMNPKHHGQTAPVMIRFQLWRKDIQEQTILAANSAGLRARTAELSRFEEESVKEPETLRRPPA